MMRYAALHERFAHDSRAATTLRFRRYRREIRELGEKLRAAEEACRDKDRALAAICHDLRTPLGAILAWAQVARAKSDARVVGGGGSRELDDALARIEAGVHTQAMLINDILDLAKSASGRLQIDRHPVDLNAVVAEALAALDPIATAKGVAVACDPAPSPALVCGDAMRLQRVVWNLVTNGVKFTPPGGRVDVTVREGADAVALRVSDTGRGIDPAFLPRIFDRFEQHAPQPSGGGNGRRQSGGTGLGLAIVRRLVELHGGRVAAESAGEGCGAAFTVSLPRPTRRDDGELDSPRDTRPE